MDRNSEILERRIVAIRPFERPTNLLRLFASRRR